MSFKAKSYNYNTEGQGVHLFNTVQEVSVTEMKQEKERKGIQAGEVKTQCAFTNDVAIYVCTNTKDTYKIIARAHK